MEKERLVIEIKTMNLRSGTKTDTSSTRQSSRTMKLRSGKTIERIIAATTATATTATATTATTATAATTSPVQRITHPYIVYHEDKKTFIINTIKEILNMVSFEKNRHMRTLYCTQLYQFIMDHIDFINSPEFSEDSGKKFLTITYYKFLQLEEEARHLTCEPNSVGQKIIFDFYLCMNDAKRIIGSRIGK